MNLFWCYGVKFLFKFHIEIFCIALREEDWSSFHPFLLLSSLFEDVYCLAYSSGLPLFLYDVSLIFFQCDISLSLSLVAMILCISKTLLIWCIIGWLMMLRVCSWFFLRLLWSCALQKFSYDMMYNWMIHNVGVCIGFFEGFVAI